MRLEGASLQSGDVVMCVIHNDIKSVANILACWLLGCSVCPLDPSIPTDVMAQIAKESRARVSIKPSGEVEVVGDAEVHGRRAMIRMRRPRRVTGSDLALIIFTSGSSGLPKGVLLSHFNVMSALRSISSYLRLQSDDRILCIPPLFFDYGLYQLLLTMFDGCSLVMTGRLTSTAMMPKLLEQVRPTVLPVVPALAAGLARLLKSLGRTAASVRLVTNTGGHLSASTIAALTAAFTAARILPMYGLTECKRALYYDSDRYPGRIDCVGISMVGLEAVVFVDDERTRTMREARNGEVGELYIRGPSVMQGYHLEHSGAGARLLAGSYRDDNWLATGDLFCTDGDGLLYFRGRAKTLIKQGGYCIYPRDLEQMVERNASIITCRVIGRQEESGDESAVLFVQVATGMTKEERKRLITDIRQAISRTISPREIHFIEEWPATSNGKIDVRALGVLANDLKGGT